MGYTARNTGQQKMVPLRHGHDDLPGVEVWTGEGAMLKIPSGKHTKNYGKIHHFKWEFVT